MVSNVHAPKYMISVFAISHFHILFVSAFAQFCSQQKTGDNRACRLLSICYEKYKNTQNTGVKHREFPSRKKSCTFCTDQAGIDRVLAASSVYVAQNTRIHQIQLRHTDTIFEYTKCAGLAEFWTFCCEQAGKEEWVLVACCPCGRMPRRKTFWPSKTTAGEQCALSTFANTDENTNTITNIKVKKMPMDAPPQKIPPMENDCWRTMRTFYKYKN